jgi:hypothetical protein
MIVVIVQLQQLILPMLHQLLVTACGTEREALQQVKLGRGREVGKLKFAHNAAFSLG